MPQSVAAAPDPFAEFAADAFSRVDELAARYRTAAPWPHLVLDDLLPSEVLQAAYEEEMSSAQTLPRHESHRQAKSMSPSRIGPTSASILEWLDSPPVVDFVRALTGIEDLMPDPTHHWAGLHINRPGDFHHLHVDFARHPLQPELWHRVNILIYLNPTWPDEWQGKLELWRHGGRRPEAVVTPAAPNVVIFNTTYDAVHGLPEPIASPDGTARVSLNCFYYSRTRPAGRVVDPLLRRPKRPQDHWTVGLSTWPEVVHGLQVRTPGLVRDGVRRLRGR